MDYRTDRIPEDWEAKLCRTFQGEVGRKIQEGLSQQEIARRAALGHSGSRWLSGVKRGELPPLWVAVKLARFFGLSLDEHCEVTCD